MSNMQLSVHFFLQLAFILIVCRIVGLAAKQIGQPQVIGEMVAGILMGPTLLGWLAPGVQSWIFPNASKSILYAVSQIGLVLYMFVIGLEFQVDLIRERFRSAVSISLVGIFAPLSLGGLLAWSIYSDKDLFPGNVALPGAMLFLGAAMAVTAFPVLSRIIHERGLTGTTLGTLALAAGAIDDAVAWCVLAIMLATFEGTTTGALIAVGGGAIYTAGVLLIGRPLLRRLGARAERAGQISGPLLALALILVLLGAWFTDTIGIHAVFGAFILGVAMPRGVFARDLRRMIEPITLNILLPLFFVYSGLNTKFGLVDTPILWMLTVVIILNACLGKGVACYLAARASGESQPLSLGIGTLMNARGLMELILLNIGRENNVISDKLFTMMVIMALTTTFIASPLFELVYGRHHRAANPPKRYTPERSASGAFDSDHQAAEAI